MIGNMGLTVGQPLDLFYRFNGGEAEQIVFVQIPGNARNVGYIRSIKTSAAITCEIQEWYRAKDSTGLDHSASVFTNNNSTVVGIVFGANNINGANYMRLRFQPHAVNPTQFAFRLVFYAS